MKKKYIFPLLFSILLVILYFCCENHESESVKKIDFLINKPYFSVIKKLSKKESLEKIIEKNNIKIVDKKWHEFTVDVPDRPIKLRQYKLEGYLEFTVEKQDFYLGNINLPFIQEIIVDFKKLFIKTKLAKPSKLVDSYDRGVKIFQEQQITKVEVVSKIKIKKFIPFVFKNIMDKKLDEFNEKDINNFKEILIEISN